MGTRSLIVVKAGGEYKVAQYCQWDGYPEGKGLEILEFLRDKLDEQVFMDELKKLQWVDDAKLRKLKERFGQTSDGFMEFKDYDHFGHIFPEFHRDTGADILPLIQDGNVLSGMLENSLEFAADSLFCEWAYVIDFDERSYEVYQGFNKTPLDPDDRFYWLDKPGVEYHPVRLVADFFLGTIRLTTNAEFLKWAGVKEEDEDL